MKRSLLLLTLIYSSALVAMEADDQPSSTRHATWAFTTMKNMTLDEKIGQLLMPAIPCNPENPGNVDRLFTLDLPTDLTKEYAERMIAKFHVGSFLYICEGQMPDQVAITNHLQSKSKHPLFFAQDLETSLVRLYDAIKFPCNLALGALTDNDLIYSVGGFIGQQAKRLGIHIVFAPVIDVIENDTSFISIRSFGEDAHKVKEKGTAFAKGIQQVGTIACAKHFLGYGYTHRDSHHELPTNSRTMTELEHMELIPFKGLIESGVASIMTAHIMIPSLDPKFPASLSYEIVTQLLKKKMGFKGLVFIDAMIMKALTDYFGLENATVLAFKAGSDIIVFPADVERAFRALKQAVESKEISLEELDKKVLKILSSKEKVGLAEHRFVSSNNVVNDTVTSQGLSLKKEICKNVITLVKNNETLPLSPQKKIAVVQIGGTQVNPFIQTLQRKCCCTHFYIGNKNDTQAFEVTKQRLADYTTVVVAISGMNKFYVQQFGISAEALSFMASIIQTHSVNLVLFGTPYASSFFKNCASIIVAYEDDPMIHKAAAQVLVGKYPARGKLPVTLSA